MSLREILKIISGHDFLNHVTKRDLRKIDLPPKKWLDQKKIFDGVNDINEKKDVE